MPNGCDGDEDPDCSFVELDFNDQALRFETSPFQEFRTGDGSLVHLPSETHIELVTSTVDARTGVMGGLDFAKVTSIRAFLAFPISGVSESQQYIVDDTNGAIVGGIEARFETPLEWFLPGDDYAIGNISYSEISSYDLAQLGRSDVLIVNACAPSGGIMVLLDRAAAKGIPAILLHPATVPVSPMLNGLLMDPVVKSYESLDHLKQSACEALFELLPEIREESRRRSFGRGVFDKEDFGQQLCAIRVDRGMTLESSKKISPRMLHKIETDPAVFSQLPVELLPQLLDFYGIESARFFSGSLSFLLPSPEADQEKEGIKKVELANLVSYFCKRQIGKQYNRFQDHVLLGTWTLYTQELSAGKTRRFDSKQKPVDWKARYDFQLGNQTYRQYQ